MEHTEPEGDGARGAREFVPHVGWSGPKDPRGSDRGVEWLERRRGRRLGSDGKRSRNLAREERLANLKSSGPMGYMYNRLVLMDEMVGFRTVSRIHEGYCLSTGDSFVRSFLKPPCIRATQHETEREGYCWHALAPGSWV